VEIAHSVSLAGLWRDQGKRAKARDLLAPVYAWFPEGFDTRYRRQVGALPARLSGARHLLVRDIATRTVVNMVPQTATWIEIGFTDVEVSKWSMDYGRTLHAHHPASAP
jgi:hypothetical protein